MCFQASGVLFLENGLEIVNKPPRTRILDWPSTHRFDKIAFYFYYHHFPTSRSEFLEIVQIMHRMFILKELALFRLVTYAYQQEQTLTLYFVGFCCFRGCFACFIDSFEGQLC